MLTKVHLDLAFTFVCPNCRRRNFVRAVGVDPHTLEPDELDELCDDGDDPDDIDLLASPDDVVCEFCRAEFETEDS